MITNSTRTLEYFKNKFSRKKTDTRITDQDVIDAYNDFSSLVDREKRKKNPQADRKVTSALSVTSSGYALSNISDLGTIGEGFRVFEDTHELKNILDETFPSSSAVGYYIDSDVLFLTPSKDSGTIYIEYLPKTTQVADGATLSGVKFGFDQDLERAFEYYNEANLYENEGQFDLHNRSINLALAEIENYFSDSNRGFKLI